MPIRVSVALADDLQPWLEHRPIAARPVSNIERVWRWCRRNPAWAGGCLLFLTSIAAFSWQLWNENRQTRQASRRKARPCGGRYKPATKHRSTWPKPLRTVSCGQQHARSGIPLGSTQIGPPIREHLPAAASISDEATPAELRNRLPSSSGLRQVAASALFEADARLIWKQEAGSVQPGLAPGGQFAVCQSGGGIQLFDLAIRREKVRWDHPEALGTALAVDASGHWLASWRRSKTR